MRAGSRMQRSPRRHGSTSSVVAPSAPVLRRTTDQPSRQRAPHDRGDVGGLELAQVVGAGGLGVGLGAEQGDRGADRAPRSRTGSSATYSGCDSGSATMSSRKIALTTSITGRAVRKLRVRWRGDAPNAERARRNAAMSARRKR